MLHQLSPPFHGDIDPRPSEDVRRKGKEFWFDNQPGFGGIRKVSVLGPTAQELIPPAVKMVQLAPCRGVVCIPDLLCLMVQLVDQWKCSNGIHGHRKGVSLGGSLLGKQYLSINKELWIVSIGVNEHLGQGRAFLLDV